VSVGGLPDNLPITDVVATFVPMLAGAMLVWRHEGRAGVARFLRRACDVRRITSARWYVVIALFLPTMYMITYWIMRARDMPVPVSWSIPASTPIVFLAFVVAAAGEELGYMGYAFEPLEARFGALRAATLIGAPWALWHLPSMLQIGQSPRLIVVGLVATVAFRVIYAWLYVGAGRSVFAVILFHAIGNVGRSVFPGGRAAYELGAGVVGYGMITLVALVVALRWKRHVPVARR
jgi:membrane protease YdiL (CAAX protease family)